MSMWESKKSKQKIIETRTEATPKIDNPLSASDKVDTINDSFWVSVVNTRESYNE